MDLLDTSDQFAGGEILDPGSIAAFLRTVDCYVMGSRTYETALRFEAQGFGWAYGDGEGISFFDQLGRDVALHLAEVKAYQNGMVGLRYEIKQLRAQPK